MAKLWITSLKRTSRKVVDALRGRSVLAGQGRISDVKSSDRRPVAEQHVELALRRNPQVIVLDVPLWPRTSLSSTGTCCRVLRCLPGRISHPLEDRVFQDAPCLIKPGAAVSSLILNLADIWGRRAHEPHRHVAREQYVAPRFTILDQDKET